MGVLVGEMVRSAAECVQTESSILKADDHSGHIWCSIFGVDCQRCRRAVAISSERALCYHPPLVFCRPRSQAVCVIDNVNDATMQLNQYRRHWRLFSDLDLVDGTAALRPITA